jgi:hypothetical protein
MSLRKVPHVKVPWYLPTFPDRIGGSCDKLELRLPETPRPCSGCPAHDAVLLHALLAAASPGAKAVSCGWTMQAQRRK